MIRYPYDEVREIDGDECGDVIGFDMRGHYELDDIELFLSGDLDEDWPDWPSVGGLDIALVWRRGVPRSGYQAYQYQDHPGRGATPVTQLLRWHGWGRWCYRHPHEPATTGYPASRFIDGESVVAELVAAQDEVDPRSVAELPRHGMSGYLYVCRECSDDIEERSRQARADACAGEAS